MLESLDMMKQLTRNTEATEWRENFNSEYNGKNLQVLMETYLNMTGSNTQYDDIDSILDFLRKSNHDVLIKTLKTVIENPTENDVIDYIRYCAWYCKKDVSLIQIAKVIKIPINDECRISRSGIEFVWNKRKDAFTKLERGLSFELAVGILLNPNTERIFNTKKNVTYAFLKDTTVLNTYFVVEIIHDKEERIISFRFTSDKEYNKIKEASNV